MLIENHPGTKVVAMASTRSEALEILATEAAAEVKTETGLKRSETTQAFDSAAVSALFLAADNGFSYAPEVDGRGAKIMQALPVTSPAYDRGATEAELRSEWQAYYLGLAETSTVDSFIGARAEIGSKVSARASSSSVSSGRSAMPRFSSISA